jgi:hypothetical protein
VVLVAQELLVELELQAAQVLLVELELLDQ